MSAQVLPRAEIERLDSMWKSPGFTPTIVAIAAAFGAWSLLLPVIPLAVLDAGGSAGLAGASTGVFMLATVITQMFTPLMLREIGYKPVMVVAAFMLGVPALGHLLGTDAWVVLLFSALRGVGFGALTVAEAALIAELVPRRLLGKATGTMGVFIGLSQMIMLPAGLFIAQQAGYPAVYATAAVIALVAVLMCLRLPSLKAAPAGPAYTGPSDAAPREVAMWKLVLVPALALASLSMSFGAVSSFLPAAVVDSSPESGAVVGGFILSVVGGAAMVSRYLAGAIADRTGQPGGLMIYAQVTGLAGMALMAVVVGAGWSVWLLVAAAAIFGSGFGAVQNEALLSMFQRLPRSRVSEASAAWNIFFDAGTGIGSVIYGAIVAVWYYSGAFTAGAVVIVVGIVVSIADRIVGNHRISEHGHLRTRMRNVRTVAPRTAASAQQDLPPQR